MHQCLVGVHHLLEVNGLVTIVGEGGIAVVFLVGGNDVAGGGVGFDDSGAEDATGKVATVGNEVYRSIQITLFLYRCSGCPHAMRNEWWRQASDQRLLNR